MTDDGLASISDQFKGLPLQALVGGPLAAAVNAQLTMARTTADFIQQIGVMPPDKDSKDPAAHGEPRMPDFASEWPSQSQADGQPTVGTVQRQVIAPILAPIPGHPVGIVGVNFGMEDKSSNDSEGKSTADM